MHVNNQAYWFLTRSTGVVTLVMLTVSVLLGIVTARKWSNARCPKFVTQTLHRNVSFVVLVFLAIHIVTAIADRYAPIQLADVVVPFHGTYRPFWLGLGALAFDMLAVLVITSVLKARIGVRLWRQIHWLAYACWPVAVLHGLGTGSDSRTTWMLAIDALCVGGVAAAVIWRAAIVPEPNRQLLAVGSSVAGVALVAGFALVGPLQPGWARRAGTPVKLLRSATAGATAAGPAAPGLTAQAVSANITGTVGVRADQGGNEILTLTGRVQNPALQVRIVVVGAPSANGIVPDRVTATVTGAQGDWTGNLAPTQTQELAGIVYSTRNTAVPRNMTVAPVNVAASGWNGQIQLGAV
jgi:DMSO/TMAO reductase YedYZ heme-binding membrane subunit